MDYLEYQEILFNGAFVMMVCDGEIDDTEKKEIRALVEHAPYFADIEFSEQIEILAEKFKSNSKALLEDYYKSVENLNIGIDKKLQIIEVLIKVLEADKKELPSEIEFLHSVISKLKLTEKELISRFPLRMHLFIDFEVFGSNLTFENNLESVNIDDLEK